MRAGILTQAAERPQQFNFNRLNGNTYELETADSIQAVNIKTDRHGSGQEADQERQEYKYTRYAATVEINNYDEAVAALVRLKYSSSDEFALMRKGQADQDNAEYAAYLDFVSACKGFARLHFAD